METELEIENYDLALKNYNRNTPNNQQKKIYICIEFYNSDIRYQWLCNT